MKRGIAVLLSVSALVAVAYFTASKWAIRHETLMFHDPARGDRPVEIDLAVRRDKELEANAGMINLPAAKKYGYWTNDELPATADEWLAGATAHEGSWWTDWLEWLKPRMGAQVPARVPGKGGKLRVIEPAPGSYVRIRADA